MPTLLLYLFKVNIALILFCAGYYFVFRKLTFYTLNRVYLVAALLFSSVYPLIDLSTVLPQHHIIKPLQVNDVHIIYTISAYSKAANTSGFENYWQYLLVIFWMGVTVMGIRLIMQFASLFNIYRRSTPQKIYNRKVRIIDNEASAFSFWQSIYINPEKYSENEIQSVVAHEDIHVKQWHTLDILLAEISLVFYWFNPGIWLIKNAISENLEFITDREILRQGIDAKGYQYSLLYASFNTSPSAVVNHFNISTIKKRIMMMNAKKSSVFSLTRYSLMMPAVAALLLVFGTSKAELIKKSIKSANEATNRAFSVVQNGVLNHKDEIQTKNTEVALNTKRPANTQLNTVAGTSATIKTTTIITDTPKVKNILRKPVVSGNGADSAYYLLNGKPISYQQLQAINPDDIHSINVLKGAAATSLFGDAAYKGAVLIVTKGHQNSSDVLRILPEPPTANKTDKSTFSTAPGSISLNLDSSAKANMETTKQFVETIGSKAKNQEITVRGYASSRKKIVAGTKSGLKDTIVQGYFVEKEKRNWDKTKFIIDKKEATKKDFDALDPNNIESINVIKDAQTKEGKIKVTTKSGAKPASKN